jgi:DNA-binding transcriptional ArsR family regulator
VAALGALGDPTRRAIFELLVTRPRAVGELANELPVSRPAVSQHLKVLKEVGLVTDHAQGTRRLYRVERRGIAALREYLDRLWDDALLAFATEVERGDDTAAENADKEQS